MPDHLHLLLKGNTAGSNLINFVKQYKQITGYMYSQQIKKTPMAKELLRPYIAK